METKRTLRELRLSAEGMAAAGITNQEALLAALPVLIELQNAVSGHRKAVNAASDAATSLSDRCTAYATKHPSVFEGGKLVENQQKVRTGDIRLENAAYHLACGYDGYQRCEEDEKMTKDFLAKLPESWRKTKTAISTTGINEAHPTAKELAKYGLKEKPKNVWSEGTLTEAEG